MFYLMASFNWMLDYGGVLNQNKTWPGSSTIIKLKDKSFIFLILTIIVSEAKYVQQHQDIKIICNAAQQLFWKTKLAWSAKYGEDNW